MNMIKCTLILCFFSMPLFGKEDAMQRLINGNKRYVQGHTKIESDQSPFAVIVACSDSRVAPEIIFDQGLGDLFVVRIAGNVVGNLELESINFAVDQLGSSLVMVLGHENCGAVRAVRERKIGDIRGIASLIKPAIVGTTSLEAAIKANVLHVVKYLQDSLPVTVVGGYFDFKTGNVEVLSGNGFQ